MIFILSRSSTSASRLRVREEQKTLKYSFFCGNGTVFDQEYLVCNHRDDAFPCEESPSLFGAVPFGEVLEDY